MPVVPQEALGPHPFSKPVIMLAPWRPQARAVTEHEPRPTTPEVQDEPLSDR